jgi:RNA polymerase-binding protein DksA
MTATARTLSRTARTLSSRLPWFRRLLLDRRRALFARLARTESDLRWLGANVEPDREDEAQEETATEMLLRLDDHGKAELAAIDAALARMAHGEYGTCRRCRKSIPTARLEAMPESTACVGCA